MSDGAGAGSAATSAKGVSKASSAEIIEAATTLLAEGGAEALTARALARAVGASTKVIYNRFAGMGGVIAAVYEAAFAELAAALRTAARDPAHENRLAAVAKAYREFAATDRARFFLMYGEAVNRLAPEPVQRISATPTLEIVEDIFQHRGFDPNTAKDQSRDFWAALHGIVSLEATGWFTPEESALRISRTVARYGANASASPNREHARS